MSQPQRILLKLEFCGTGFSGWQLQNEDPKAPPPKPTLQFCVEQALASYWGRAFERYPVVGCGRTDSGVHAFQYFCHFDHYADRFNRPLVVEKLVPGLNGLLPSGVAVLQAWPVGQDFHCLRDVKQKTYLYRFLFRRSPVPLEQGRVWWMPHQWQGGRFQSELFLKGLEQIQGPHDFKNFAASDGSAKTSDRHIFSTSAHVRPVEHGHLVEVEITGNGFLKQMVRNLMGTLVDVAMGRLESDLIPKLLNPEQYPQLTRQNGGLCAPAEGLFLKQVDYGSDVNVGF